MRTQRKPDNIHVLQGTARPDHKIDTKPRLKSKLPKMPDWLDDEAKSEWRKVIKVLKPLGILTAADETVIAQYCVLYSRLKRNPEIFGAALHTQLRYCAQEIGLTPGSRDKLAALSVGEERADPWSDL